MRFRYTVNVESNLRLHVPSGCFPVQDFMDALPVSRAREEWTVAIEL